MDNQEPNKIFLIMKLAATFLMAAVFALLIYHSNLHDPLFTQKLSQGVPDLGPVSARPATPIFQNFHGQVVHINFWAKWCKPCTAELPLLKKMQKEFGARYKLILINIDQDKKRAEDMNVTALPFHVVADKNGKTAMAFYGSLENEENKFKDRLRLLLSETLAE